jgi:hypothetical protein
LDERYAELDGHWNIIETAMNGSTPGKGGELRGIDDTSRDIQ